MRPSPMPSRPTELSAPPREPLHQGQRHMPDETPQVPGPEGQPQRALTDEIGTNPQHRLAPVSALTPHANHVLPIPSVPRSSAPRRRGTDTVDASGRS